MASALEIAFAKTRLHRTHQRALVVRLLAEAKDHPTAEQLHARARQIEPGIGRAAVLGTLKALAEAGLATVIETRRDMFRYEDATLGPHDHIVDRDTGELINVTSSELDTAAERAAASLGYELQGRRLMIWAQRIDARERT